MLENLLDNGVELIAEFVDGLKALLRGRFVGVARLEESRDRNVGAVIDERLTS